MSMPTDQLATTPFDPWSGTRQAKTTRRFSVPLVVAVTGHRDLLPVETARLRELVRAFLTRLRDAYPDRQVAVICGLAEGADRLVAEEALALDLPLTVALPMPRQLYEQDFANEESRAEFARLCAAAVDVFALPITPGNTESSIAEQGQNRSRQYAQLGVFLCAHCHVLLALWDGKPSDRLGGTAQVVRFHHDDVMPGYTPKSVSSRLVLTDDESDLVYHIVCSRNRPDGAPAPGLQPLEVSWFTTDDREPRVRDIPNRHRLVFERTNEFSRDARVHAAEIGVGQYPLLTPEQAQVMPPGLQDINRVFCVADWLAVHYQRKVMRTLRATHVCVLLMGVAYVSYTDVMADRWLLFVLLGLMLVASGLNQRARRGDWHRKYLDYRTLAEGLRVQFYWAAAGVTSGTASKFAHDNFLQMQDPDLGWIRNVMRVAGTECDITPNLDPAAVQFVLREWIGDDRSGQLGYYGRRSGERLRRHADTKKLGRFGLWGSAVTLLILLFVEAGVTDSVRSPLVFVMGIVLLGVGIRQAYAQATAESELIKQYEFMHRIFHNARRRIDAAEDDVERRRILRLLGDAALEEHAEWILMHRERAIDQKEIVKLS
jgi:sulfite exporter TauE/SafE